jgi:Mce-associated membrane protein
MTVDQDSRIDGAGDANADEDDVTVEPTTRRYMDWLVRAKRLASKAIGGVLAGWRTISMAVVVLAAVGLTVVLFFVQYRPDQQTDEVAARAAIKAASEGTVALLSYTPESIDNDLAAARSHLTGDYARYFNDFGRYFLGPSVRQQNVKASASVARSAVVGLQPNSAVVLEIVHQTTTSKDKPEPVLTTNNVRVTLSRIDGSWLIAKFEPE